MDSFSDRVLGDDDVISEVLFVNFCYIESCLYDVITSILWEEKPTIMIL